MGVLSHVCDHSLQVPSAISVSAVAFVIGQRDDRPLAVVHASVQMHPACPVYPAGPTKAKTKLHMLPLNRNASRKEE